MARNSVSFDDLVQRESAEDEDFRAEWQRLAPAREFAAMIIRVRAARGLTQTALARELGISQARVAQLESGERNPDFDTILAVVKKLKTEFVVDVRGAGSASSLLSADAVSNGNEASFEDVTVVTASLDPVAA